MGLAVTKQEAFWEACGYGRIYEVKSMLAAGGININWKSYTHDCCPIHVASQGKREIVEMLLAANCEVNVKDDRDNLPIHHAAMKGHADIIQLLINAGSLIDSPDKNGWTPLLNAAYWCQPQVCSLLVSNKCNVHLHNKDQRTALHEACRSESKNEDGLEEIVQLLIECGCDIDSKGSDGEVDFTPLMFCAYHGHPKVAKVLIDADCRINEQGKNKWSALHWAADRGNTAVVEVLLHGGIDVFIKGMRDELAIDRATDNKIIELITDAMKLNITEHKIAMETRGSASKKLYIPTAGANDTYINGLATSPRGPNLNVATSPVFQSMQAQMVTLTDQMKSRKTKRTERKLRQRIFEPPSPPADESENDKSGEIRENGETIHSPVSDIIDGLGFMDDCEDDDQSKHRTDAVVNGNGGIGQSNSSENIPDCGSPDIEGTSSSESKKVDGGINGFCHSNGLSSTGGAVSAQEVELFDENEIDGDGFEDSMLK